MQMSHTQTKFFMGRFLLFYNRGKIARILGISRPTVESYIRLNTTPDIKMLPVFEEALAALIEHIDEHSHAYGKWAKEVADAVDQEVPKWTNSADPKKENQHVVKLIRDRLKDGVCVYKDLENEAYEKGFTRSQVQYAGKCLGVIKEAVGKGRNAYSLWRLP